MLAEPARNCDLPSDKKTKGYSQGHLSTARAISKLDWNFAHTQRWAGAGNYSNAILKPYAGGAIWSRFMRNGIGPSGSKLNKCPSIVNEG